FWADLVLDASEEATTLARFGPKPAIVTAAGSPSPGRSSGTRDREFPSASAPPSAAHWPDFPTTNAVGPRGLRHNRAGAGAPVARAASRRDAHFFVGAPRGRTRLSTVHFQSFLQCIPQIVHQFFTGLALRVDARNLLDPADPPFPVLLDDC